MVGRAPCRCPRAGRPPAPRVGAAPRLPPSSPPHPRLPLTPVPPPPPQVRGTGCVLAVALSWNCYVDDEAPCYPSLAVCARPALARAAPPRSLRPRDARSPPRRTGAPARLVRAALGVCAAPRRLLPLLERRAGRARPVHVPRAPPARAAAAAARRAAAAARPPAAARARAGPAARSRAGRAAPAHVARRRKEGVVQRHHAAGGARRRGRGATRGAGRRAVRRGWVGRFQGRVTDPCCGRPPRRARSCPR